MKDTRINPADIRVLLDNQIKLFRDADKATELLNRFGHYLTVSQVEGYIKAIKAIREGV